MERGLRHSDSELSKLVELEQYQEDHVLDRVAGDIGDPNSATRSSLTSLTADELDLNVVPQ